MTRTDLRHLFEVALENAPPDTIDLERALSDGRRRGARRRAAAVVATTLGVAAVLGVAGGALGLARDAQGTPSTSNTPSPSDEPFLPDTAVLVTDAHLLTGTWNTVTLDGQDVRNVRDRDGLPLSVRFVVSSEIVGWVANDGCNATSGEFSVTSIGVFEATTGPTTLVGCRAGMTHEDNPGALPEADRAYVQAATADQPAHLFLTRDGRVLASYAQAAVTTRAEPQADDYAGWETGIFDDAEAPASSMEMSGTTRWNGFVDGIRTVVYAGDAGWDEPDVGQIIIVNLDPQGSPYNGATIRVDGSHQLRITSVDGTTMSLTNPSGEELGFDLVSRAVAPSPSP